MVSSRTGVAWLVAGVLLAATPATASAGEHDFDTRLAYAMAAGASASNVGFGPSVDWLLGVSYRARPIPARPGRPAIYPRHRFGLAYHAVGELAFGRGSRTAVQHHRFALLALSDRGIYSEWGPELVSVQVDRLARLGPGIGLRVGYVPRRAGGLFVSLGATYAMLLAEVAPDSTRRVAQGRQLAVGATISLGFLQF